MKMRELPSLEEIHRRIEHTVKDIEVARSSGHAMMQDQYEKDLIWLVHMKVEKLQQIKDMMIEGVPV